jgi:methionyl-tRNA formyltransferase
VRLIVSGQRSFGAAALRAVADAGHEVALVVSPTAGRGWEGGQDRLRTEAAKRGLPWCESGAFTSRAVPRGTDLIVAAHSHAFISKPARQATRLGGIGYHPSLLPRHRGRDAVKWTVAMRDCVAGGSVYWLSDNVDCGDIAAQDWCHVRPDWTASDLWREELFPMGLRLLVQALNDLQHGTIVAQPQDEAVATWEPSWEREPLHRPELPEIGNGPAGFTIVRDLRRA